MQSSRTCHCLFLIQLQSWSSRGRPWPWGRPRGHILKSLASKPQVLGLEALGPRKLPCPRLEDSIIFWTVKILLKTPETSQKICKYLSYFAQLERRLSQAGLPPQLKFHQWQKCDKKAYCFFSFSFFLAFFVYTSSKQQYWRPRVPRPPKINFCQPF